MGFQWTTLRVAQPQEQLYDGRPAPPWPPLDVPAAAFTGCLDCATRSKPCRDHGQDCPRMQWRRGSVIYATRDMPPRRRWRLPRKVNH